MKVKIGNKVYDSEEEPIMIILEEYNKEHIRNMPDHAFRYCEYPDDIDYVEIEKWMADE